MKTACLLSGNSKRLGSIFAKRVFVLVTGSYVAHMWFSAIGVEETADLCIRRIADLTMGIALYGEKKADGRLGFCSGYLFFSPRRFLGGREFTS